MDPEVREGAARGERWTIVTEFRAAVPDASSFAAAEGRPRSARLADLDTYSRAGGAAGQSTSSPAFALREPLDQFEVDLGTRLLNHRLPGFPGLPPQAELFHLLQQEYDLFKAPR